MPDKTETADCWTWSGAIGESISGFIGDTYLFGKLIDLLFGLEPEFLGISTAGLVIGALIAVLSASGSAYAEKVLFTLDQDEESDDSLLITAAYDDSNLLERGEFKADAAASSEGQQSQAIIKAASAKPVVSLSACDYLALTGAAISHAGYFAGNLSFIINFVMDAHLSRTERLVLQCVALVGGGLTAYANVRTRHKAMLEFAHKRAGLPIEASESVEAETADCWTWLTTVGELIPGFIGDLYLFGKLVDLIINFEPAAFGLSIAGALIGAVIAVISAGGSAYAENILNTQHQNEKPRKTSSQARVLGNLSDPDLGRPLLGTAGSAAGAIRDSKEEIVIAVKTTKQAVRLSCCDKFALVGAGISHTGYFAGNFSFIINFVVKAPLSRGERLGSQAALLAAGVFTSVASIRTRRAAMKERAEQQEDARVALAHSASKP